MIKRLAVTCMLALFIFAALMYFATLVHFSTHNDLVHAQGPWTLTVSSAYDSPSPPSGSFDDGTEITEFVTSPVSGGPDTQYICTGWYGTGSVPASGTASIVTFNITVDSSITWNWKTQYFLTVSSAHDTPGGGGWYDSGSTAYATLTDGTVSGGAGTQYVFTQWGGDASGSTSPSNPIVMSGPMTATADWKTQYYLTVSSVYGTVGGDGWYDSGAPAYATVTPLTVSGPSGTRYAFDYWSGDASGSTSPSNAITMNGPMTAAANWRTQYYLTVSSVYGATGGEGWYDSGSTAYASVAPLTVSGGAGTQYVFTQWGGDASGSTSPSNPIVMSGPMTATADWKTEYYLTVSSAHDSPTPVSGWFDSGAGVIASVASPSPGSAGTQYACTGWTGTGSVPGSGSASSVTFTIIAPSSIVWNWKTQYQVTFDQTGVGSDFVGTVVSVDSVDYGVSGLSVSFWWDSGSSHSFSFASPLAVGSKRYVWGSTSGLSSLQGETITVTASGSVVGNYQVQNQVTFDKVGVSSDFTGTVVIIDSVSYSRSQLPVSFSWSVGSTHSFAFQSPLVVGLTTEQYVWTSTTGLSSAQSGSIIITNYGSIIGHYKTQYYLTVSSPHDSPSPVSGWFDSGSSVTESVTSPVSGGSGTQYVCTGWTGTGSVPSSGSSSSVTFTMAAASGITWNWQVVQHKLTVSSAHDTPSPTVGNHLYDDGSSVTCSVSSPVNENGTVWTCTGWTGAGSVPPSGFDSSVTFAISQNSTITWNWHGNAVQRKLTVFSAHGTPSPAVGDHLYDDGDPVNCSITSPVTENNVTYVCTGWSGYGSAPSSGSGTSVAFTISQNSTITWNWQVVQWTLTVVSNHGSPSPAVGNHLYNDGSSVVCNVSSPVVDGGVSYTCTGWIGSGSVPSSGGDVSVMFSITQNSSITWNWTVTPSVQWTLTVSSAHGSPDPAVGDHLYNDGSSVVCNVSSPVVDGGVSFTCTGWTGSGSVTSNGSVTFTSFTITENSTITWNWVVTPSVQWTLTVVSAHGTPSPAVGNHLYDSGRSVACSITSPVTEAGQVWTCTGWTGSGSVTSSGSGTSVSFTLTENSSITWNWRVQSTIGSCDGTGVQKNVFKSDETVFVTGRGYGASRTYNVYIVNETTWVDGMTIPGRVQGTATSVSSDSSGNINPTAVWSKPLTPGNYDILVDFNGNGKYDAGVDALYSSKIMVTSGYSFIPEYVFGTILGLAGCFAALGAFRIHKRKRQQDT